MHTGVIDLEDFPLVVRGVNHVVTALENTPVFSLSFNDFFLKAVNFGDILENLEPADDFSGNIPKSGRRAQDGQYLPLDVGNHIFPVMNVATDLAGFFQGTVRFTDFIFEYIFTIHPNSIGSRKTGDFFSRRVEICDAQLLIRRKQAIWNAIQYFNKAFLFLINFLQGFVNVIVDLAVQKIVPSTGMVFSLFPEIITGQARRDFLVEIPFGLYRTQGVRDMPAIQFISAMRRTQHSGTGKQLPAGRFFVTFLVSARNFMVMTFQQ